MEQEEGPVLLFLETDRDLAEILCEGIKNELDLDHDSACFVTGFLDIALQIFILWRRELRAVIIDDFHISMTEVLSFIRRVRSDGEFHGELIAFTGNPESMSLMIEAGCTMSLPKPFEREEFRAVLRSLSGSGEQGHLQ